MVELGEEEVVCDMVQECIARDTQANARSATLVNRAPERQRIVMIYHSMSLGGVETLIVRAANAFHIEGHSVTIFARSGELQKDLQSGIEVINFDRYKEVWKREVSGSGAITILAFDPLSYMVAKKLQLTIFRSIGARSNLHAGIFHPRALSWPGDPRPVRFLNQLTYQLSEDDEFYFMTEAVRAASSEISPRAAEGRIVRIPISYPERSSPRMGVVGALKIVSVGRLVEFKAYNRHIPRIAADLRSVGVDLIWDIWGYGDDEVMIRELINEYGVQQIVTLKGRLPYSSFGSVVSDYDLFVGMGTSAVEAAGMGIPTICCVDLLGDTCYGYLYEAPLDAVGEHYPGMEYQIIARVIKDFAELDAPQRVEIGLRCRAAALIRSPSEGFDALLFAPSGPKHSLREKICSFLCAPYLFAVDSRRSRFLFRKLREIVG